MRVASAVSIAILLTTAASTACLAADASEATFRKRLQLQLIQAKPGEVIQLPAGKWSLRRPLSLNKSHVTLRGEGPNATILSFKDQIQGAEGLSINAASGVTIENLAIEDPKGDALKANGCTDLTIRHVRVEWTGGPSEKNGGYGLYPVQCERVLIEHSTVMGASDAGIYVGQSKQIVVRDNRIELNVVGIEIENSTQADVYRNDVTNNTGGILVINMPNLPVKGTRETRVYDNRIYSNNTENFAPPGNVIARVPAGTGFMVIASDDVEFFRNRVEDNQSANAMIVSFAATGKPANDRGYDAYPQRIWIHDNRFSGGGDHPDQKNMRALRLAKIGAAGVVPDILWDGVMPRGLDAASMQICLRNNENADFANIDLRGGLENLSKETTAHECEMSSVPPVTWTGLRDAAPSGGLP
jgi:parallel beta-helix repeat protein